MSEDLAAQLRRQLAILENANKQKVLPQLPGQPSSTELANNAPPITIRASILDGARYPLQNKLVSWTTDVSGLVMLEPAPDTLSVKVTPMLGTVGYVTVIATTMPSSNVPVRESIVLAIIEPQAKTINLVVETTELQPT